jgi:flavin-binding protein dodecin
MFDCNIAAETSPNQSATRNPGSINTATPHELDSVSGRNRPTKERHIVSVAKVIEITSTSPGSFEDAIRKGIAKAQLSIENIKGAWISEHKVELADDGTIKHFRVDMKLTFVLD